MFSRTGISRADACRLIRSAGEDEARLVRDARTGCVIMYSRKRERDDAGLVRPEQEAA